MPSVCHQVQSQKYEKKIMKIPAFNEIQLGKDYFAIKVSYMNI